MHYGYVRTLALAAIVTIAASALHAQTLRDANLGVRTVVGGLNSPTAMAFIGANDFLIGEKSTGKVIRVTDGTVAGTVLDLAVNSASERGLLGLALHPLFT